MMDSNFEKHLYILITARLLWDRKQNVLKSMLRNFEYLFFILNLNAFKPEPL